MFKLIVNEVQDDVELESTTTEFNTLQDMLHELIKVADSAKDDGLSYTEASAEAINADEDSLITVLFFTDAQTGQELQVELCG